MTAQRDPKTGRFLKRLTIWNGTNWDDGWIDSRGRFRVYRPDYPRAYSGGYALRAHVVWWLAHGKCHPKGTAIHHKNNNKIDDELENLQLMPFGDHTAYHSRKHGIELVCEKCEEIFTVPNWRIKQRQGEGASSPRFCSQQCYHATARTPEHKQKISRSLQQAWAKGKRHKSKQL